MALPLEMQGIMANAIANMPPQQQMPFLAGMGVRELSQHFGTPKQPKGPAMPGAAELMQGNLGDIDRLMLMQQYGGQFGQPPMPQGPPMPGPPGALPMPPPGGPPMMGGPPGMMPPPGPPPGPPGMLPGMPPGAAPPMAGPLAAMTGSQPMNPLAMLLLQQLNNPSGPM